MPRECCPRFSSSALGRALIPTLRALGAIAGVAGLGAKPPLNPEMCDPQALSVSSAEQAFPRAESTRRMAARLESLADKGGMQRSFFQAPEVAAALGAELARTTDLNARMLLQLRYAEALLNAGDYELALQQLDNFEEVSRANHLPFDASRIFVRILTDKAMCCLRIGEQDNCVNNHNADSCLLPIRDGGVHRNPRGSRAAMTHLSRILEKYPGDLRARWLLNLAAMTLGEYPEGVPTAWRIDPQVFASEYPLPRFHDVAQALGVDRDGLAGGVVMDDFDNDGLLDLMVSGWGPRSQLRYYHNDGNGKFKDRTGPAGLVGETGGLNMIQADFNNDGFVDVLVLRGAWLRADGHLPSSLLRNNGDGTFTDVTEEAGLLNFHPTGTGVWFDYNRDGWLDLFVGNESTEGDPNPCRLFRSNGDGTFTDCARECGVAITGFVKAAVSADFNHDGWPDVYLSRLDGANLLLRNDGPAGGADRSPRGPWHFTDVAKEAGVTEPFQSFSAWFWDYDNDGWADVMVTGYDIQDVGDVAADRLGQPHGAERARLYHNNRDGTFSDVSKSAGVFKLLHTMGCNFGDLDNDGWLDFYVGTGNPDLTTLAGARMFRNDGAGHFQDVTTSGGFGQIQKGHAIAFGDINNDGAQDIYFVVGGAFPVDHYRSQLFANPRNGNHWLTLKLEGTVSNRSAIGARVKVVIATTAGEREISRTVGSGASFGASPLRQEIGLGDAKAVVRVEVWWPTAGATQTFTGLELDRAYTLKEREAGARMLTLRSFALPGVAAGKTLAASSGGAP